MSRLSILIFFILNLIPMKMAWEVRPENPFVMIWDVGQGQWVSYIEPETCTHFDMGGEYFPKAVFPLCKGKFNRLSVTHWDKDHTSFILRARKRGLNLCIDHLPRNPPPRVLKAILNWRKCEGTLNESLTEVFVPKEISSVQNNNSLSFLRHGVTIPGDSPAWLEEQIKFKKSWSEIDYLIVGHHGSRTSSSRRWLRKMTGLRMALVSARRKKYGHPHPLITSRFRRQRVPLISTDDWGTIKLPLRN